MMHYSIRCNPKQLQTFAITSPLDDVQGTVQAGCSIWWTPVRLQVTGVNKRSLCDSAKSPKIWARVHWPSVLQPGPKSSAEPPCRLFKSEHSITKSKAAYITKSSQQRTIKISTPIWSATQDQVLGVGSESNPAKNQNDTEGTSQSDPCMIFKLFRVVTARPETSCGEKKVWDLELHLYAASVRSISATHHTRPHQNMQITTSVPLDLS